MRSLSIQVQPNQSPGIDMHRLASAFGEIAAMREVAEHHAFDNGGDDGPYVTGRAGELWRLIQTKIYESPEFSLHMKRASIAMCSSEAGWDDYLLLAHFDPAAKLDAATAL
jgi:hypothetical protein